MTVHEAGIRRDTLERLEAEVANAMIVGRIGELWRYPVKSMKGERIDTAVLGANGIPGDRGWAVRDEVRGGIRGAKKIAELMRCGARYLEEPESGRVPAPEITLPDGARLRASDADASKRLSQALRNEVTLWPLSGSAVWMR